MGFKNIIINDFEIVNGEPQVLEYDDNEIEDAKSVHIVEDFCEETIQDDTFEQEQEQVPNKEPLQFPVNLTEQQPQVTMILCRFDYNSLSSKFCRFNENAMATQRAIQMEKALLDNMCNERILLKDLEKKLDWLRSTATPRFSF